MATTVLIVDDIEMMRRELRRIVETHGLEAVDEYERLQPQVVLMDITMPKMDGLAALRAIRARDPGSCVIMCSAMSQQSYILSAVRSGARDFVVKPFHEERIVSAVRKALPATDR
jgi:two-component system chemotaxis response regulator CheY